ncbi:MAG: hypothetical protein ACOYLB_04675 [Phototrophicaceae bacterium]
MTIPEISPLFIVSMCGISTVCLVLVALGAFVVFGTLTGSLSNMFKGVFERNPEAEEDEGATIRPGSLRRNLRSKAEQSKFNTDFSQPSSPSSSRPSSPSSPRTTDGLRDRMRSRANEWNPTGGTTSSPAEDSPSLRRSRSSSRSAGANERDNDGDMMGGLFGDDEG